MSSTKAEGQKPMNVLFIMCDQLRWDYLSCYGHPHLHTPHIDRLAERGVRFNRAYVQSPICGPSRMSFYTGRYVSSHGSTWNNVPLKVGELTLGDHLRGLGVDTVLCGKTHMKADKEGMERLGIEPDSIIGVRASECGFDVWERDDGLHPSSAYDPDPKYDDYLREKGWNDPNPWQNVANSGEAEDGTLQNGWFLQHSDKAARVAEEDSETPYMTRRAMAFIEQAGDTPWCLHLSYIKPHWPYIAPAPYHNMYGPEHFLPVVRDEGELVDPHPVFKAFLEERTARNFAKDHVRETVLKGYMGLIKQIDDQMGELMAFLEARGLTETTMIVFTSDHGDYMGDHFMGEKDLFHEPSVRVPLIIVDPRAEADATRGSTSDALVEAIDLAPTFVEFCGGTPRREILEGKSLLPILHGTADKVRDFTVSEYDYALRVGTDAVGVEPHQATLTMVFDGRWKYVHAETMRPMLFDLESDPNEFKDLGADPDYENQRARMRDLHYAFARRQSQRTTISDKQMKAQLGGADKAGVIIGAWDESDLAQ